MYVNVATTPIHEMSHARLEHLYRQVPRVISEVELSTYMIEVHFGFHFFRRCITRRGKNVTIFFPSKKSVNNFREKTKSILNRRNLAISEDESVRRLNLLITGWINYFNHASSSRIYNGLQKFIDWIFYKFLVYRHKKRGLSVSDNLYTRICRNMLKPMSGVIQHSHSALG